MSNNQQPRTRYEMSKATLVRLLKESQKRPEGCPRMLFGVPANYSDGPESQSPPGVMDSSIYNPPSTFWGFPVVISSMDEILACARAQDSNGEI